MTSTSRPSSLAATAGFATHATLRIVLSALPLGALAVTASAPPAAAREFLAPDVLTLNDNGAWSWFEDERAVVDTGAGKLLVSSVADSSGPGGAARDGDVDVVAYDLDSHAVDRFTLHDDLQDDDHNSAALYVRPDGRYVAMYGGHLADSLSRWRVSSNAGDVTGWTGEQAFDNGAAMTYSNLHYLPGDDGGAGRLYNFVRSNGFDPNILVSSDQGDTWSYGGRLLEEGGGGDRPYLRYASDGQRIHFITTERHPRDFDNSIYHGYIEDGSLYNSSGDVIDGNLFNTTAAAPDALTQVMTAGATFGGDAMRRAWTVDVAIAGGAPVAVFQARANNDDLDHRFFYGRWDGGQWRVHQMAFAGSYLYGAENDYTGLVSIDPDDPATVYLSSEVHPETKAQLIGSDGARHYELFRGTTSDGGATWSWTPLTFNSAQDNVRPVVPQWDDENTAVLWMRGQYNSYTNFDTRVVGAVNPAVAEPQVGLKIDFGQDAQEVQAGFEAFTRPEDPGAASVSQAFASPFASSAAGVNLVLEGSPQFRDRGDDVAGPLGPVVDDFAFAIDELSLTFENLQEGDYQLVLYAHDRDFGQSGYEVSQDGVRLGQLTPTEGASPAIGVASARVAFHANGLDDPTFDLTSVGGGAVVLNGIELWAGSAYASPPPVDLNGDGLLNLADYAQYVDGLHADLSGLSSAEAFARGDLNGDLRNDFADFRLFQEAYDQWNGAGALSAALAVVPEPTASALALFGVATLSGAARQRE